MSDRHEDRHLLGMAEALAATAEHLAKRIGADPSTAIGALGFAQSKLIFQEIEGNENRMKVVQIMSQSSQRAMADMIAGQETTHQVTQ